MSSIESEQPAADQESSREAVTLSTALIDFAARVYIRVVIFLTVYVLSIGPMYWSWHASRYEDGEPFYAQLYFPLEKFCEFWPAFGRWVNWYVELWVA